ncbi:hypothetical protein C9374_001126 [Naegleria lovaniensis]|uniref:TsaA-like domain-containing protein n=1 Tax=Naegleria lovaniensis TaxID=51637 RepID=A0AA88GRI2_NAELO|nr:uncharacterized protein C9374_001126 [Naegleria lovaniensis]KAG2387532.1 hypothetical protein C9374_001126 [Naegleria lovaniensis]
MSSSSRLFFRLLRTYSSNKMLTTASLPSMGMTGSSSSSSGSLSGSTTSGMKIVQYFPNLNLFKIIYEYNNNTTMSKIEMTNQHTENKYEFQTIENVSEFEKDIEKELEPSHVIQKPSCVLYRSIPTNSENSSIEPPFLQQKHEHTNKPILEHVNNDESKDNVLLILDKGTKIFSIEELEKGEWRLVVVASSLWLSQQQKKKGVKRQISDVISTESESSNANPTLSSEEEELTRVYVGYIPSHYAGKLNRKTISSKIKEPVSSTDNVTTGSNSISSNPESSLHNEVISNYDSHTKTYSFNMKSIGVFHSVFPTKNGCPRQFGLVDASKGILEVTIPQGDMALDGLEKFSHCWLIFVFHENSLESNDRVKIRPPRMNGNGKVGIYATRSPHRPNGIGMSVAKIDKIEGKLVYLSGADLIDGTPVIDIKPYISRYDSLPNTETTVPEWIQEDTFVQKIDESKISFSQQAVTELEQLLPKLRFYDNVDSMKKAIIQVLQSDPRPVYMRKRRDDKLYGFRIDNANVRCKFEEDDSVEIVTVELWEE